jgi:hypothetical protein
MRVPFLPAALALSAAALLYSAYHANQAMLRASEERPLLAVAMAKNLGELARSRAETFHARTGRWPQSLAEAGLDGRWMRSHRGIESVRYGAAGTVRIVLDAASDGARASVVWTPSARGGQTHWDCESDLAELAQRIAPCRPVGTAQLTELPSAEPVSPLATAADEGPLDLAGLDARCEAIGKVGYAAALARAAGDPADVFVRRPVVAFTEDAALREELEQAARWIYAAGPAAPRDAERAVLSQHRCWPG